MSYVAVGKEHSGNIDLYEDDGTGIGASGMIATGRCTENKRGGSGYDR